MSNRMDISRNGKIFLWCSSATAKFEVLHQNLLWVQESVKIHTEHNYYGGIPEQMVLGSPWGLSIRMS